MLKNWISLGMHPWILIGQAQEVFEGYVILLIVYTPANSGLKKRNCDHPTSGLLL